MGRSVDEDAAIKIVTYECGEFVGLAKEIEKQIRALPSAQPERKMGKWIYTGEDDGNDNAYCYCSICGAGERHCIQVKVRYCWNCGAEMKGEDADV